MDLFLPEKKTRTTSKLVVWNIHSKNNFWLKEISLKLILLSTDEVEKT